MTQLDAFGRPPPPQKLNDGRGGVAKELASKLNMINLDKQKRIRGELMAPSEKGMVNLCLGNQKNVNRCEIRDADVQKWRDDVLSVNRPRISCYNQQETAESAREYARKIASTIPKTNVYQAHSESEDDGGTRSDSATNSLPSLPEELIVATSHERKYSDYSSASSQKSPTPPSQSSFSDYSSACRSQVSPPDSQRSNSPLKADTSTRVNVSSLRADHFSPMTRKEFAERASPKPKSELSLAEILSRKQQVNSASIASYGVGLTQQVRLTDQKLPAGKPPTFRSLNDDQKRHLKWQEISNTLETQDRKFERLSEQMRRDLVVDKQEVGLCANCRRPMYETEDRYKINDSTYHKACFTCEVCGKELREQQFYLDDGRFYCKQDYLYNMDKKVTRCFQCKEPIQDMVLSALNRNYHPACFRCAGCGICLDGVPFALDKENQVYCMPDYHERFAPRCYRCRMPILPDENTGETVRIVALENNYHIECYSCEGCGLKLTDDGDACCYPLGKHLLCERCHMHWRRSGAEAPISDL
ncbi:unnamed protein product [Cylicocyclus nassatus]|uniref:LIM zinc-binding domain-containing protein n=1 Tax=Cylicocyclus nassatus TaxID=53992 RepID=A0AA36GH85_CYLNA|nr:unnamed protein product [Cylicocyclus nassatus]